MNVEKQTAAEAAPDAPVRTAQTEKTALILAPGFVSRNSATLQSCIRAGEEKRRRKNMQERPRAPTDRKIGKQRGYETKSAEKRVTSEMKSEGANLSRNEKAKPRGYPPRRFLRRKFVNDRKQIG